MDESKSTSDYKHLLPAEENEYLCKKHLEERFLTEQMKGLPTEVLLDYKKHQQRIMDKISSGKAGDNLSSWSDSVEKLDTKSFLEDGKKGIIPTWLGYAVATIPPIAVGLLTSTVLKGRSILARTAGGVGAAAGTLGIEILSDVNNDIESNTVSKKSETKQNLKFIDKELARRNAAQTSMVSK